MKWILRETDLEGCFQPEKMVLPKQRELTLAVPSATGASCQSAFRPVPVSLRASWCRQVWLAIGRQVAMCALGAPFLVLWVHRGWKWESSWVQMRWAGNGLVYLVRPESAVLAMNRQSPQEKRIKLRTFRQKIRQKVKGKEAVHDKLFFFFGCVGSLLLSRLSLVAASRGCSSLQCAGFSSRWLLLLQSTGSRHTGFSSCAARAQQLWFAGSRAQAQ